MESEQQFVPSAGLRDTWIITLAERLLAPTAVRKWTEARMMNDWISVKDRFPEPNEPVVTYGRRGSIGIGYITEGSISTYRRIHRLYFYARYGDRLPTHWMPLPEPPKEGQP